MSARRHTPRAWRAGITGSAGLALALASVTSARAHASPLGMYGYGSRSSGLNGAVSADVADASANYYNPAGLVRATTVQLTVGYAYASHALAINGRDTHVDPVRALQGGVVAPGRVFGMPFAFGLGFYLPDDRLSRSRALPQAQPRWELYDNSVQILSIVANLAIAPTPWLRLGGGLGYVSSTRGRLDITGDISFSQSAASQLYHTIDADLTSVRYPQFGAQVDVLPNLTLAAAYRGEYAVRLSLDALVDANVVVGRLTDPSAIRIPGTYSLRSVSTAVFQPQQAVLGASWQPLPSVTVMADVTWLNWSAYVNPTALLEANLSLTIPPGLAGFRVPTVPPGTVVLPAGFHDTFVPRVAAEYRRALGVHTLALRAGYRFDASPVSDQTGGTNFADSNRHVLSAGVGFTLRGLRPTLGGGLAFDLHAAVQLLEDRTVRKANAADPVGDYAMGGSVVDVGGSVTVVF